MTTPVFLFTRTQLACAAAAAIALGFLFQNTFVYLYANWQREEYSHGFLIPLISGFLLWQRRREFEQLAFKGSWAGVLLILLGLAVYFVGSLASIMAIDAYALVMVLAGCVLATGGWKAIRLAAAPLGLLLLMNPLPTFLYNNLSSQLQLISSQIGVAVIRLFGISVHLEGNVIDLGSYKLQVVEACSGLRYLFPLLTLGVVVACFLKCKAWVRWVVVLSTIPITIGMNSFRIGVIGVLVDRFGIEQAEGFLHDFEGWIIFMACFVLLIAETWLLLRISGDRRPFRESLSIEFPAPRHKDLTTQFRPIATASVAALILLVLAVYPSVAIPKRTELRPPRTEFIQFPMRIGDWEGRRDRLESMYVEVLKFDDYILANYRTPDAAGVNLYATYYASQRTGVSAHSPASCLPGGGWRMSQLTQHAVNGVQIGGAQLQVNRVVIEQGSDRQLVYYWFQQRGRDITNEYLVKWYLFRDLLTRNRSDGALVRLITPLSVGEATDAGDVRLTQFTQQLVPLLGKYVPD